MSNLSITDVILKPLISLFSFGNSENKGPQPIKERGPVSTGLSLSTITKDDLVALQAQIVTRHIDPYVKLYGSVAEFVNNVKNSDGNPLFNTTVTYSSKVTDNHEANPNYLDDLLTLAKNIGIDTSKKNIQLIHDTIKSCNFVRDDNKYFALLIMSVMYVESGWQNNKVSNSNARGIMQIIPKTALDLLVSLKKDPRLYARLSVPAAIDGQINKLVSLETAARNVPGGKNHSLKTIRKEIAALRKTIIHSLEKQKYLERNKPASLALGIVYMAKLIQSHKTDTDSSGVTIRTMVAALASYNYGLKNVQSAINGDLLLKTMDKYGLAGNFSSPTANLNKQPNLASNITKWLNKTLNNTLPLNYPDRAVKISTLTESLLSGSIAQFTPYYIDRLPKETQNYIFKVLITAHLIENEPQIFGQMLLAYSGKTAKGSG